MSYALDMEKSGPKKEIEMPPLPPEPEEMEMQEEAPEEVETSAEPEEIEASEPEHEEPEESPQPAVSSKNERNIRYLREKAEQADKWQRERDEAMRALQELMTKQQHPVHQQAPAEPEEEWDVGPDDLVEGKYLKKYDKKIQQMQEKLQQYERQAAETNVDNALRKRYPDIDQVLSKDNIAILNQDYPEIAETLRSSSDTYTKAVSAYTMIKKLGIDFDDPYAKEKEKATKNAYKPRPVNSIAPQQGNSPLSKANAFANGLTPELKKQLEREMFEARRKM